MRLCALGGGVVLVVLFIITTTIDHYSDYRIMCVYRVLVAEAVCSAEYRS